MPTATAAPPGRTYATVDHAAERLAVSRSHVCNAIGRGDFPGTIDVSREPGVTRPRYRIPLSALAEFEARRGVAAA